METTQIKKASEEYAKKYMDYNNLRGINGSYKLGFKQGAEWALNQYKWINQKEHLPEQSEGLDAEDLNMLRKKECFISC